MVIVMIIIQATKKKRLSEKYNSVLWTFPKEEMVAEM